MVASIGYKASSLVADNSRERVSIDAYTLNVDQAGQRLNEWAQSSRQSINQRLDNDGAILIRGLKVLSSRQFGQLLEVLFGEKLIDYSYRSTPRTELRGRVYTATEYHPSEIIPQHNENSYTNKWAMRIGFFCLLPAVEGGETPIADSRLVYQNIDPAIREEFVQRKIMYVRNYGDIDLPWQEVFQSDDKNRVEEYCTANDIQFEWLDDGGLRTRQIRPAIAKHPRTGEPVWFNQAHLFHVSNLDPAVQESLLAVTDESGLPRNTYFADGGAIPTAMLDHIRQVYDARQMVFPWKAQDVLLLDNMLFSHGRKAFDGQRKVLVGMACPYLPPQQSEG